MARLLLLLALLSGCVSVGGPPLAPSDFSLVLSEGGGFTGVESGAEVQSDGAVRGWGDPGLLPTRLSDSERQTLWNQLRVGYRKAEPLGSGSLTRTIRVRSGRQENVARWVRGSEPDLDDLYEALWETIRAGPR